METRRLDYFVRIVECRSITKAAAQIGIAQPALSQQLGILEAEFKTKLLHRTAKGVEPTAAGADLYRQARIILRQMEQAHEVVKSADRAPGGPVSVGFPTSTAQLLSLPFLIRTRERFPRIQLQITEGLSGQLSELVMNARLDVSLLFQPESVPGLTVEPLWNEDLLLIGPPDAKLADPVPIAKAAKLPLVMPAQGHGARVVLNAVLARQGLAPTFVAEIDSVSTLKAAVQAGLGYTFLPWTAVHQELQQGSLSARAVDAPNIYRTASLCTPSSMPRTRPMECVMTLLRELADELLHSGMVRGMRPVDR